MAVQGTCDDIGNRRAQASARGGALFNPAVFQIALAPACARAREESPRLARGDSSPAISHEPLVPCTATARRTVVP